MPSVRVSIIDPTGSKKTRADVPDDVGIERLVKALVSRLGLPSSGADGRIINYRLVHVLDDKEKELQDDRTLGDQGIRDDDLLRLYTQMLAGGGDSRYPIPNNELGRQEPTGSPDLDRLYTLINDLQEQVQGVGTGKIVEQIRNELQNKVEPFSIPIIISEQEKEPIPMVRADRLHIIEEYRDEENKWFSVAWAFIGSIFGVIINWITSETLFISRASLIILGAFVVISIVAWLSARQFQKRAERYKYIILYGENSPKMKERAKI